MRELSAKLTEGEIKSIVYTKYNPYSALSLPQAKIGSENRFLPAPSSEGAFSVFRRKKPRRFARRGLLSQGKSKYSQGGKVSHRLSHNIPIKPYTSPLSFQLQLLRGRGHFSTNFLPIILHENPSIFPSSPFLFFSLFSSPSSHLTSSATRNYEIQRDPLQLLLCSHFLLPTVKLGIGK